MSERFATIMFDAVREETAPAALRDALAIAVPWDEEILAGWSEQSFDEDSKSTTWKVVALTKALLVEAEGRANFYGWSRNNEGSASDRTNVAVDVRSIASVVTCHVTGVRKLAGAGGGSQATARWLFYFADGHTVDADAASVRSDRGRTMRENVAAVLMTVLRGT